ncbi:hypothetical protein MMC10_010374 [Thelotrema lepadinum]|nr:hypothetical protein [Thelotrema lepadinum]
MKYTNTALAVAAVAISAVRAQGTAVVVNMCEAPAYIWSVGDEQSPMVALPNQTVGYQEPYRAKSDASGISIKIAPTFVGDDDLDTSQNITQFEYTLSPGTIWYDISYVNGNAFQGIPVLLQPSDSSCPNVTCAATDGTCKAVYNNPNDDTATHACGSDADLFFLLCAPSADGTSTSSSATNDETTSSAENVVVDASGNVQLAPAPAAANKATTAPTIGSMTSISAFNDIVTDWKTFAGTATTKRDELSTRHSHKEFHARRSRISRHSH